MSSCVENYEISHPAKRDRWMFRHAGSIFHVLDFVSIQPVDCPVSSATQAELICSYNWIDRSTPSVLVPGGAPIWTKKDLPIRIQPDSGPHFIDQNSSKVPQYPFEVVFRALKSMGTRYRFDTVDTLVNRNSLRKLFDFCAGHGQDSFRIDLHSVHNTLIMERCERSAKEMIHGSARSGYGHNFERVFTKPAVGLEDSTSHHRVLRYDIGGLDIAVHFEVDASYSEAEDDVSREEHGENSVNPDAGAQLAADLDSLKLSSIGEGDRKMRAQSVFANPGGYGSAQSTLAELKTSKKSTTKIMPQMWFGRTPYLIRGLHDHGVFEKLVISRVGDNFQSWETNLEIQTALRKMVGLIARVRNLLLDAEEHAAIMIFQKDQPGKLRVLRRTTVKMPLPDEIVREFWSENTG